MDLSFLLEAPAGKDGFIRAENGHLIKPNGGRFRIWGVNVTYLHHRGTSDGVVSDNHPSIVPGIFPESNVEIPAV